MNDDLDELLRPTVTAEASAPREKPWRVQSQFWVAFFGGALALSVIAVINARRLGVPPRKRAWMIVLSLLALAVIFGFWLNQPEAAKFGALLREGRELRLVGRVTAVLLFLALAAFQRPADAHFRVFTDAEYASLWSAGIASTLILGSLQTLLLAGAAWLIRTS